MRSSLRTAVSASDVARELGLTLTGDDVPLRSVAPLSAARPGALTFATRALPDVLPEALCVISKERPPHAGVRWIASSEPRLDFIKALLVLERLGGFQRATEAPVIDPTAFIHPSVAIGKGVVIGAGTRIEPHVTIADDVRIGRDCWLKSGCVVGESGFGFERAPDGSPIRFLHFGGVIIGDRVEVGSVTTVVQGTLGPTVIEDDAKVDDHVHVAHNVRIQKNAFVIACAELSGGVVVGEAAWIGPNASVLEGVKIGARALVGLGCVVLKDVPADTTVVGNPARVIARKVAT
ncbi:MAG: bacterial transferase hexapeptide family protein 3 [Labilithrix sp.]|nr:bacterial transferase hexapeptide family protein 3 [Labilithrix sp.]